MEIRDTEIWRQIPPEEKIDLLNKAHSTGVFASFMVVILAATLAVGFKASPLLWGSLAFAPVVFQLAAGRAWRRMRPRLMLEYLAARSAARRYAFSAKSKDLGLSLIFKGEVERVYDNALVTEALAKAFYNNNRAAAWIALFNDAVVIMTERPGGAKLEFAQLVDHKLNVDVRTSGEGGEASERREVIISGQPRYSRESIKVKITSRYPASMLVFSQKLSEYKRAAPAQIAQIAASAPDSGEDPEWMRDFNDAFDQNLT